ncbi:MAG: ribosome recycling factor [Bdellovibrionales bacterium]|nr:ribosome recycling factor [Bdellovibrionales bacterium]
MIDKVKQDAKKEMEKVLEGLGRELQKIRTGKANPSMLDPVKVDYYGQLTPLSQVSAISCPDAKSFMIAPWEASLLKAIETAIVKSEIGMAPINDGKVIRLKVPELTEDRRKDLVKQAKKIVEDARVGVRLKRQDANQAIKKLSKDKAISEDDGKKAEAEIQKVTDQFMAQVEKIASEKEKDIMTI